MSFNNNDNNSFITLANYEEFFLLYVDNELSDEERIAVDNFLLVHPDLQVEMDILLSTKLTTDEFSLEDKSSLHADSMKLNAIDESLLLYIDDELNDKEKKAVEKKIKENNEFGLQHQLLLKTKLDATETINYPYKSELYHRTEGRITPYWLRIAAAAIIVAGAGLLVYTNQSTTVNPNTTVAIQPTKTDTKNSIKPAAEKLSNQPSSTSVALQSKYQAKAEKKVNIKPAEEVNQREEPLIIAKANKEIKTKEFAELPQKIEENDAVASNETKRNKEQPSNEVAIAQQQATKQTINNPDVTSSLAASYKPSELSPKPAVERDVAMGEDNEKKSSLKGILRKATRFIERRTNIKATNEDDELLIGVVALKL